MPTQPESDEHDGFEVPPTIEVRLNFIPGGDADPEDSAKALSTLAAREADYRKSKQVFSRIRRDPVGYFARQNRGTWPTDMLNDMGNLWTYSWSTRQLHRMDWKEQLTVYKWSDCCPLPVGREALRAHVETVESRNQVGYFGDWEFLLPRMPLAGSELALVIVVADVDGYHVEAFGLGVPDDDLDGHYRVSSMKFRLTGEGAISDEVQRYTTHVSAWWGMQAGAAIRNGGRIEIPLSYEHYAIAWHELYHASGGYDPATLQDDPYSPPEDKQVMQRLREKGFKFSRSTYFSRKRGWAEEGFPVPPPIPDELD